VLLKLLLDGRKFFPYAVIAALFLVSAKLVGGSVSPVRGQGVLESPTA
jgi:hypothetical protein